MHHREKRHNRLCLYKKSGAKVKGASKNNNSFIISKKETQILAKL